MRTPAELALWRVQYEELYKSMVNKREQFMAWEKELARARYGKPDGRVSARRGRDQARPAALSTLEAQLPRKFEKLYFMLKQPLQ
jgi:hypothetical protein